MSNHQPIRIESDSELATLLDQVGDLPLTIEYAGRLYRIERQAEPTPDTYDPAEALASLRSGTDDFDTIDVVQALSDLLDLEE